MTHDSASLVFAAFRDVWDKAKAQAPIGDFKGMTVLLVPGMPAGMAAAIRFDAEGKVLEFATIGGISDANLRRKSAHSRSDLDRPRRVVRKERRRKTGRATNV